MYCLKQASRLWNVKLDIELKKTDLKRFSYDPCVYYMTDGKRFIIIGKPQFDDLLLFSNNPEWLNTVKRLLSAKI